MVGGALGGRGAGFQYSSRGQFGGEIYVMIKNRKFSLPLVIMIARLVVRRYGNYKAVGVATIIFPPVGHHCMQ